METGDELFSPSYDSDMMLVQYKFIPGTIISTKRKDFLQSTNPSISTFSSYGTFFWCKNLKVPVLKSTKHCFLADFIHEISYRGTKVRKGTNQQFVTLFGISAFPGIGT